MRGHPSKGRSPSGLIDYETHYPRYRELTVRASVAQSNNVQNQLFTALGYDAEVIAVRVSNDRSANNHLVRVMIQFANGELKLTDNPTPGNMFGKDGLGGYRETPWEVPQGTQLSSDLFNDDAAGAANIALTLCILEWLPKGTPVAPRAEKKRK